MMNDITNHNNTTIPFVNITLNTEKMETDIGGHLDQRLRSGKRFVVNSLLVKKQTPGIM